ncbi:MAG: macro domain-containing protein [Clostridiales bacterium]|nr:macro domain-containing protein [Candidatus Crickella merdequi]
MSSIEIRYENIVSMQVDAIVNAANEGLRQGGGVCGAIFQAADTAELVMACMSIGHCDTGQAVITPSFGLPAPHIIHAVGPVWHGGDMCEDELLYSTYGSALAVAKANGCHSIAFPLISSGIFGYPLEDAWRIAIKACRDFIAEYDDYEIEIIFAVIDRNVKTTGEKVLAE